jgi:hypothetical protein
MFLPGPTESVRRRSKVLRSGSGPICDEGLCSQQDRAVRRAGAAEKNGTRSRTRVDAGKRRVVIGDRDPSVTGRTGLSLVAEVPAPSRFALAAPRLG